MLVIKNNLMAANSARLLSNSYRSLAQSVERLSSGYRINSAKDDAAGLAVRELLRADIVTMRMGARNARDGISMLQTMEGGMEAISETLTRIKQLAEQAATGSYSDQQRRIMDAEFAQMIYEIDRVANQTDFNKVKMLNEPSRAVTIHSHHSNLHIEKVDSTMAGLGLTPDFVPGSKGSVPFNGIPIYGESLDTEYQRSTEYDAFTPTNHVISSPEYTLSFADYYTQAMAVTIMARFSDTGAGTSESWMAIPIISPEGKKFTVEEVAERINTQLGYEAAHRVYDEATSQYVLKVDAQGSGADRFTAHTFVYDVSDKVNLNIRTQAAAQAALGTITEAIEKHDTNRAAFGYYSNRLDWEDRLLNISAENALASKQRIDEVDYATEVAAMTRRQVLAQAGTSVLAQANSMPQMAMGLLR